jgi:peptidoglycan L-alanyl-D-glutamate endopeptidase CwlK
VREAAGRFLALCDQSGLDVLVYCTLRTHVEQAALFASGRTVPGAILTNAGPGQSLHNPDANGHAWAFDAVPLLASGKAAWGAVQSIELMGICGEHAGLEWAGRWRGALRERVHFQMKGGRHG